MIVILSVLFVFALYGSWQWWQGRHWRKLAAALGEERQPRINRKTVLARIPMPTLASAPRKNLLLALVTAAVGAFISVMVLHQSPVFGLVFGGLSPFALIRFLQYRRMQAYRQDAKAALEFASAIFSAGGTVEDWVQEVVPRLEGPLRDEFAQGARQIRQNIPVPRFLERLTRSSPDPFFRWAVAGILANYQSAGDLEKFIAEVMDDLGQQERLERMMKQEQKNFTNMLAAILMFPAMMYLLFKDVVNSLLEKHWEANIVLLVGLIGYIAFFALAARMARPRILE